MGSFVVQMLSVAMETLLRQDAKFVDHVLQMDDTADFMDLQIEHKCMRLLALQQPMSRDLRIIGTSLKIITDLERIGDYAVDIAKTARRLAAEPWYQPMDSLRRMGQVAEWMVRESIHSFVECDLDLVEQVVARDDEVDAIYDRLFEELLDRMQKDPTIIRQATWILHVGRFLERTADHAVNVAERVYYVETGELKRLARPDRMRDNGLPPGQ